MMIAEIEKLKNELVSESEMSAKKAQIRTNLAFSYVKERWGEVEKRGEVVSGRVRRAEEG